MSMLTPPGMGGEYRIKGDRYPRMRRPRHRHRIVLATVGTAAAVGLVSWGTLELVDTFGGGGGTESARAGACSQDAKHPAHSGSAHTDGGRTGGAKASVSPSPASSALKKLKPKDLKVNVLNATDTSGLAKKTSDALKKRGFTIGDVTNAPKELDGKVKGPGLLMAGTGPDTAARLKVLATQVAGADTRYDDRKGTDVDLVIGKKFKALTEAKSADAALQALAHPSPSPSAPGHCAKH